MKKVLLLLFMFCILLTGCGNNAEKAESVKYNTLEEMNEAAGTNLVEFGLQGVKDEAYSVVSENIAQYTFKINDEEWTIRASKDVDNDISGLNLEIITFEKDMTNFFYNDDVYALRFFDKDWQYFIYLNVKDKDIARSYFDELSNNYRTTLTGVESGYKNEIVEEGNDVLLISTVYEAGEKFVMKTIYSFSDDKMASICSEIIFETEDKAKDYYDMLISDGTPEDSLILNKNKISSPLNTDVEGYGNMTKAEFIQMMKEAMNQ